MQVVTLNLWSTHGPVVQRMEALATWLRETAPDVVLLQEAGNVRGWGRCASPTRT